MDLYLEVAKILVGTLTPVSIACVGWVINSRLKTIEQQQWGKRKLIEKRLEIFERVSPQLNQLFCFCMWVGNWKEITPKDALFLKRDLDRTFNIYRFIIGDRAYRSYQAYINTIYSTYNDANKDARLRVLISGPDGDRRQSKGWQPEFEDMFHHEFANKKEIREKYMALMIEFRSSIGISEHV